MGDFVFTYHGIDPATVDSRLWLVVMTPDPDVAFSAPRFICVGQANGTVRRFERGDIVSIVQPDHDRIACGIANYGSEDISRIRRLRSSEIADTLGHHYGDEVVHRNNMVVLS